MSIKFKTLTKVEFPYIDDGDIDSICGIMYGKNASIDLICVNPNQDPTNQSVVAVFKLPEQTKNVGSVYMNVDDVWKRRLTSSFTADYENGLLYIPNCRSATGQTYKIKLSNCFGYVSDGHSYPRQVLEHFFSVYGKIAYTASNFDQAKWENELDHADVQADIAFLLDDDGKDVWDVVYEISRKSKSFFRVDYDSSGRIYAKRIDMARSSRGIVPSCDIRNAATLSVTSLREGVFSSVLTKYFYNSSSDTWLSVRNNTYENEVRQVYRQEQELEEETFLVNSADAIARAYNHATKFADIQYTVDLEVYENLDLDLYDVLTVALMPDNLSASARKFAGNRDCLVIATNPNARERVNYITVQIIPDRVPAASQEAVVADTFKIVERPKSTIEIVQEESSAMANIDAYLTNPAITLFTDELGVVGSYADAVGIMRVLSAGEDVTANALFSIINCPETVTAGIDETGAYSITAATPVASAVTFAAEYGGVKITKTLSVVKRMQGVAVVPVVLIPDDVSSVSAVAEQDGIAIKWNWSGAGLKNTLKRYRIEISDDNGVTWLTAYSSSTEYFYAFNRDTDGYPGADNLSSWRVRIKAENMYSSESLNYTTSSVTTTWYVDWTPSVPAVATAENGRGPTIGWSDAARWYGAGTHDIQIAKGYTVVGGVPELITDLGTLTAYAPAVGLNPRDSYDNFKSGSADGFLTRAGTTLALSLPLYGQNEADAVCYDTPYYVRVRSSTNVPTSANPSARLTSEWGAWNLVYARGTVQDLVKNAIKTGHISDYSITANKILVEMLSAITANIGVITDGAFVGSENNRWALSRVYAEDGITVLRYEGAMRVGGADQYLEVKPVVVGGVVTDYTIDFKVGTFTVTATGSTINGDFVVKSLDGLTTWASIDKTTGAFTILEPSITSYTNQVATTKFAKDVAKPLSDISRVCQINGDGVPMFPDNVAGAVSRQNNFSAIPSGWIANNSPTSTFSGGIWKVTANGAYAGYYRSATSGLDIIKLRVLSGSVNVDFADGSAPIKSFTPSGSWQYAQTYSSTGSTLRILAGADASTVFEIADIYIGSGLYDTPVYDKACCNRATNYGVLPVNGTRGQVLSFNGGQYLQFDNPVIGTTGTIAFKFKTGSDVTTFQRFAGNALYFPTSGISIWIQNGVLNLSADSAVYIATIAPNTKYTITIELTSLTYTAQVNEILSASGSFTSIPASGVLFIGRASHVVDDFFTGTLYDFRYDSRIWTQADVTRYHNGDDAVDSQQKAITAVPHSIVTRDASGNIEGNNFVAKTSGNYEIEIGQGASVTGIYGTAIGVGAKSALKAFAQGFDARATAERSIAVGFQTRASTIDSIAIGTVSYATGISSLAINGRASGKAAVGIEGASASGDNSIGIGVGADTTLPHEINLGDRIHYLEFASTATQATVYTALSALMNPTVGSYVGAIGRFGIQPITEILRSSSTAIQMKNNASNVIATFNSGNATEIGTDLQICFVQYTDVV